jgi:Cof subfamily protein (haloacid dehalogenase superfamily)
MLIADVDGTLVTKDKRLTARTRQAIAQMRAAGVLFGITSGRPPRGMAMLMKPLGLTTPVAAFNGGMLVRPDLTTVIEQHTIARAVAGEVVDHLREAGLDVWVYRGVDWFIAHAGAYRVERERSTVQFDPVVISDVREVLEGAVKIVGVSADLPRVARCEAELQRRIASHATVARSQPYYVDITHPDANKGNVVRLASQHLKIPVEQIAAIGDMANDVLMFGVAGVSIAMGNASAEVKRAARYVTTANDDEGFANAVDWFVLGHRAPLGLPPGTRACLFELDGVLAQSDKLHAIAWKQAFDETLRVPVPFDPATDYAFYVDGRPPLDGARSFLASRGLSLPDAALDELVAKKDELLAELLAREPVESYGDSLRFVRAARQAGLRTAVVSASKHCREVLESSGMADLFDAYSDTLLAGAEAVGVDPAHSAVFEDALAGVEAGRAGHFGYVVGVDRVGHGAELRRRGADVVVTDLEALLR